MRTVPVALNTKEHTTLLVSEEHPMNDNNISTAPTVQQQKYLGRLLARAHEHGVPYLPTGSLSRKQVSDWIDYLKQVVGEEEEPNGSSPYLITPPRDRLPPSSRPAWQDLPDTDDHEHLLGTIIRADGMEQSICALCGVSA